MIPSPIHEGSVSLWHLSKVLSWLKSKESYEIDDSLIEISGANMQVNLASQMQDVDPALQRNLQLILA